MNSYLASVGPGLANHLWQSTAFGLLAWLITLALRSNQARVRYAVWLAASIKFLLPFSLLVSVGHLLPQPKQPLAPVVYSAMNVVEEPFAMDAGLIVAVPVHVPTVRERVEAVLPVALGSLWVLGFGAVLFAWGNRWRVLARSLRHAVPATEGRELEILRRVGGGDLRAMPLLMSAERMEPGVFGIFRPVLVWPAQLSAQLDDHHIEAIVAHELTHVRRHDNLTASLHMLVEAAFWFHPLVWWIERQMVKEREQACDEAVVAMGGSAETYAESLLKTCWFCVESPLPCVAGVTGSDLKRRVADIISGRALLQMTWPKKLMLAMATVSMIAVPMVLGQVKDTDPTASSAQYDVVSVKENKSGAYTSSVQSQDGDTLTADNANVMMMVREAYGLPQYLIEGLPSWGSSEHFDIKGKILDMPVDQIRSLTKAQRREMLAKVLQNRFALKAHWETRDKPEYELVLTKSGSKLKESQEQQTVNTLRWNSLDAKSIGTEDLAKDLQEFVNKPVVDRTGLTGKYDVKFTWSVEGQLLNGGAAKDDTAQPVIFTAVKESLGLELKPTRGPVQVLVVDHIEKPTVDGAELTKPFAFDVASVRPSKETKPSSNIPLGGGDAWGVSNGLLSAKSLTLIDYIYFAYRLTDYQLDAIKAYSPDWVSHDRYTIEARTEKRDRTKDQMRLMMQSLLSERFKLAFHYEKREVPVFDLVMVKTGVFGPMFRPHPAPEACISSSQKATTADGKTVDLPLQTEKLGFLKVCGAILGVPASAQDRWSLGGSDVPMSFVAARLPDWGNLGRPVMDQTGLNGKYDFVLDFTPEPRPSYATVDSGGPSFQEALKQQLGLRLEPKRRPVEFFVIDHIERPDPN